MGFYHIWGFEWGLSWNLKGSVLMWPQLGLLLPWNLNWLCSSKITWFPLSLLADRKLFLTMVVSVFFRWFSDQVIFMIFVFVCGKAVWHFYSACSIKAWQTNSTVWEWDSVILLQFYNVTVCQLGSVNVWLCDSNMVWQCNSTCSVKVTEWQCCSVTMWHCDSATVSRVAKRADLYGAVC